MASSNSPYLGSHLKPQLLGTDRILLEKCIFENQEWTLLELLIIHDKAGSPELTPFGKIAGVESIPVLKPYLNKNRETLWSKVMSGSITFKIRS